MMSKEKIPDNCIIIASKPLELYLTVVLEKLNKYDSVIFRTQRNQLEKIDELCNALNWALEENVKRKLINVTKEFGGEKRRFKAVEIRLDLLLSLKTRQGKKLFKKHIEHLLCYTYDDILAEVKKIKENARRKNI